jgi:hypothetical protein
MPEQNNNTLDKELTALTNIIKAIEPLDKEERIRVLNSISQLIGASKSPEKNNLEESNQLQTENSLEPMSGDGLVNKPCIDIRTLTQTKSPKTSMHMAAVVAYYLQEIAPQNECTDTIGKEEIIKYFKQASFKLPKGDPMNTLHNTKNAGYLDPAGNGRFKLNPVGYNLVAHSLPVKNDVAHQKKQKRHPAKKNKNQKNKN